MWPVKKLARFFAFLMFLNMAFMCYLLSFYKDSLILFLHWTILTYYLLCNFQHTKNGSTVALIWGALPQPRSDRRKDRVETNPEQLTAASVQAEISFSRKQFLSWIIHFADVPISFYFIFFHSLSNFILFCCMQNWDRLGLNFSFQFYLFIFKY